MKTTFSTTASLMSAKIVAEMTAAMENPINQSDRLGTFLPTRRLGDTGAEVTLFGLGGSHVGEQDEKNAQAAIELALEKGVRFFDTAESYQKGGSEKYFGHFLTPKYRDVIYLMTKTRAKDAQTARQHLEGSLQRMNTDHLDLWLMHAISSPEDVNNRLAGGVLAYMLQARDEGKVRHIGFSGHRRWQAHEHILKQTSVMQACQMPINVVDPSYESFIGHILPKLTERNMGVLAMKTAAYGTIFEKKIVPDRISLEQLHYFVWSLPVSTLIGGFANLDQLRQRLNLAGSFKAMTQADREQIIAQVKDLAGPDVEFYKKIW